MIYWAPLLHFYQPPTQTHWVLNKVCEESYRPLIEMFRNNPTARVTVNICATLTELFVEHGMRDIISGMSELAENRQLEFTGSAKYHPILPLIPREEILRQITQNDSVNRRWFGSVYAPRGFFPPEMCYSEEIDRPVIETGHEWIILSGVACPCEWPLNNIRQTPGSGRQLAVFYRDDVLSNLISFRNIDARGFLNHLTSLGNAQGDVYVVTAMDAETFGHHIKSWEKLFLEEVYDSLVGAPLNIADEGVRQLRTLVGRQKEAFKLQAQSEEIRVVTISELLDLFQRGSPAAPKASSWSASGEDIKAGNPYPLWNSPTNMIHQLQWEHMRLTLEMVGKAGGLSDNPVSAYYAEIARGLMDRALHSDQFWWASRRPNWDINLVNRGLMQQQEAMLNAYKSIRSCGSLSQEQQRECRYREIGSRDLRAQIREELFGAGEGLSPFGNPASIL